MTHSKTVAVYSTKLKTSGRKKNKKTVCERGVFHVRWTLYHSLKPRERICILAVMLHGGRSHDNNNMTNVITSGLQLYYIDYNSLIFAQ